MPKHAAKNDTMAETLRRSIKESRKSLSELARDSGVDASRLSRFVRGERDLTFTAAAAVAEAVGLRLSTNLQQFLQDVQEHVEAANCRLADKRDIPDIKAARRTVAGLNW